MADSPILPPDSDTIPPDHQPPNTQPPSEIPEFQPPDDGVEDE